MNTESNSNISSQHRMKHSPPLGHGLVGWLEANVIEHSGRVLSVQQLTQTIVDIINIEKVDGYIPSPVDTVDGVRVWIYQHLDGAFQNRIYKLRREFYTETKKNIKPDFVVETNDNDTNESIIARYFEKLPSRLYKSTLRMKEDLYIVGYDLIYCEMKQ